MDRYRKALFRAFVSVIGVLSLTLWILAPNLIKQPLSSLWPIATNERELARATVGFVWPEYGDTYVIVAKEQLKALAEAVSDVDRVETQVDADALFWRFELEWRDGSRTLLAGTRDGLIYDLGEDARWESATLQKLVLSFTTALAKVFFGELLTWDDARSLFPVGGKATVRDLETGRSFRVYRHRGDAHADVEPLTAEDAATLKEIYGGRWSWKRRAVVLTLGGRQVAASMNGMPHGWGDIFDNCFVGHSCIHFWRSRTHGTWQVDPGHQLMVMKAAGKLTETLDSAPPTELASWGIAAVNHRDVVSLRYMAWDPRAFDALFTRLAQPVRHITFNGARALEERTHTAQVEVSATVYFHHPDPNEPFPKRFTLVLRRSDKTSPWRVDLGSLMPLVTWEGR